uniref:Ig-like domain-containing protein n=1 Tax=Hucho hucho TaxID=62062 RepID=A0A4W5NIG6_9TELE
MRTLVFLHAFALVCVHSRIMKDAEDTRWICGEDSVLRCKANSLPRVKYQSVRWYKLGEEPSDKESGLLMKRLSPNSTTLWYAGLEREVELLADDSFDIFLPNVTAVDSGWYKCLLAAPVGEQNQEGQVHLRVTGECVLFSLCLSIVLSFNGDSFNVTNMDMLLQRSKKNPQEQLLDAPFEKKDFMLIYTLGPNWSGQASIKHVCV